MNKFIRIIENNRTSDITFMTPYQVLDEVESCYMILDDIQNENWVDKEYCEEVRVMITEVLKSQLQKEIEELEQEIINWSVLSMHTMVDAERKNLSKSLYEAGFRKTK